MNRKDDENRYLILDSRDKPLAYGRLEQFPDAHYFRVRVLDKKVVNVLHHEVIQLIGASEDASGLLGRILQRDGDCLVLERLRALGKDARQNLRMPVSFSTFLYPVTGEWKGRRVVESLDLSCGGVAFFCGQELQQGELAEIVIPITTLPLVVTCEILRRRPDIGEVPLYQAKFVNLCHEEEMMIREAVFSVQLSSRPAMAPGVEDQSASRRKGNKL